MHSDHVNYLNKLQRAGTDLLNHTDDTIDPDNLVQMVRAFLLEANYEPLGGVVHPLNTWYRARPQSPGEPIRDHLSELLYRLRPAELPGRVHVAGERVFYAGWNAATAFAEVNIPTPGSVWLTHVRPKNSVQMKASLVGAYESFFRSGRLHYPIIAIAKRIEQFFASERDHRVASTVYADSILANLLRNPDKSKYHLTRAIFRLLHASQDATMFLYPSVQVSSSMNMATTDDTFDECFEVLAVERFQVELNLGSGLLVPSSHHVCHDMSVEGHLNWFSQKYRSVAHSFESGRHYSDEPGWTVPSNWHALKRAAAA